ncbi:MAG: hypothetical protein RLP44_29775, partial [Aggregatilineales bacterium]
VYLVERNISAQGITTSLPLPIPVAYPHDLQFVPVTAGGGHLFWIDAIYNQPEGDALLWMARLNENAEMPRAHIRLADIRAETFDVIADGDGGARVLWTGGSRGEPTLYLQAIDVIGRPNFPQRLTTDARFPAFITLDDGLGAYWLRASDHLVIYGDLVNDELENITSAIDSPLISPADRIVDFHALTDSVTTYLFWMIVRGDGSAETWFAHRPLSSENWSAPERLGIGEMSDTRYETTFNGGSAFLTSRGENWLQWSSPLSGNFDFVTLAGEIGDELVIMYLAEGSVIAVQPVVTLNHALIGAPALVTDRDRHLYLTWSEPTLNGAAHQNFTSTKDFELTGANE